MGRPSNVKFQSRLRGGPVTPSLADCIRPWEAIECTLAALPFERSSQNLLRQPRVPQATLRTIRAERSSMLDGPYGDTPGNLRLSGRTAPRHTIRESTMLALSRHASRRLQQRAISPTFLDCLLYYGARVRSNGADIVFLDRKAKRALSQDLGTKMYSATEKKQKVYAVVGDDGNVITAGYRFKRIRRRVRSWR